MGIVKFNWNYETFYSSTPIEFNRAIEMVQEKEKKQEDKDVQKFRTSWEVSRYLAKHIWNSQGRTLKRLFKKDTDFEKFYWEVEERVNKKQQSQSEMKTILMGFAAGLKTIKKKKS